MDGRVAETVVEKGTQAGHLVHTRLQDVVEGVVQGPFDVGVA